MNDTRLDDSDDIDPPIAEQTAFSMAHELIARLSKEFPPVYVARGVFLAVLSCFGKNLPDDEVAKILYKAADDYAVRDHE